jgi:hypothetical protein
MTQLEPLATSRQRLRALQRRVMLSMARRRHHVLVLGDSHAQVFESWRFALPVHFDVESVNGATLSGLQNPNSVTRAGSIFEQRLALAAECRRPPVAVIVLLGEVDCGFVIWWSHEQRGLPLDEGLDRAVAGCVLLLERARRVAPVIVISAPLPTLGSNADFGDDANLRREIKASQEERTALVREFNARVQEASEAIGATYLNLDPMSLGSNGLVSPLLALQNQLDHHYDAVVYGRLLEASLCGLPEFRACADPALVKTRVEMLR